MVHHESSQDRPTNEPPETTPIFYTVTALGPAVIGTDYPDDASILYHNIGTTTAPVATTTISFPAEVTPAQHGHIVQTTVTETTYLSTITVSPSESGTSAASNLSITAPGVQKRQICSMVFASIDGEWVSWCNEWNGYTTVKYSTYTSTELETHPPGADPIPTSVYEHSTSSKAIVTIETSLPSVSTTTVTSGSLSPISPVSPVPSISSSASPSTSSSEMSSNDHGALTTEISLTATVVVTYPIATVTSTPVKASSSSTIDVPAASSSCGEDGALLITFDNLPTFSTNKPDNETTAPPIFNPYSHFFWSTGFGYGPPPNEPFTPHDGTELAEYNPAYEPSTVASNAQGRYLPGSFGAGPRSFNNIFWFDAKSVYIGCNSTAPEASCNMVATGYRWVTSSASNATTNQGYEQLVFVQNFQIPGTCPNKSCPLVQISFAPNTFTGLSTLNLLAYSPDGEETGYFLDSFQGAWTNDTCEAGQQRAMSRR